MALLELGKQLLEAAKSGSTEEVRILMFNGAPFTTDWLGTSSLHYAAQNGQYDTVEVLLKAGLSRDAKTKVDRTPLHYAAQEGHSDIAQLLLSHGADMEAKDMLKMTPLHWAVERGHIEVVQVLLSHGASTSEYNKFDKTPVDIAIRNKRADILELLQSTNNSSVQHVNPVTIIEEVITSEAINNTELFSSTEKNIDQINQLTDKSPSETLTWLDNPTVNVISVNALQNSLDASQMFILTEAGKLALKTVQNCDLDETKIN